MEISKVLRWVCFGIFIVCVAWTVVDYSRPVLVLAVVAAILWLGSLLFGQPTDRT